MATQIDARVKQKTGVAADFAGYNLLEGEIALVRTSPNGPVWNFKVGPGNFDSLDWSLQNPGAAQEADTSTVFPSGVPGLYIPTENGTYNGITVDLSAGYTQLIWDGTTLVKVEFPIDLSGYATTEEVEKVTAPFNLQTPSYNLITAETSGYWAANGTITSSAGRISNTETISIVDNGKIYFYGLSESSFSIPNLGRLFTNLMSDVGPVLPGDLVNEGNGVYSFTNTTGSPRLYGATFAVQDTGVVLSWIFEGGIKSEYIPKTSEMLNDSVFAKTEQTVSRDYLLESDASGSRIGIGILPGFYGQATTELSNKLGSATLAVSTIPVNVPASGEIYVFGVTAGFPATAGKLIDGSGNFIQNLVSGDFSPVNTPDGIAYRFDSFGAATQGLVTVFAADAYSVDIWDGPKSTGNTIRPELLPLLPDAESSDMYLRGLDRKKYMSGSYMIISMGQSNQEGREAQANLPGTLPSELTDVKLFNRTNNSYQNAQLGVNTGAYSNTDTRWGYDWGVFKRLADYLAQDIYVLKRTRGGTPLAANVGGSGFTFNAKFEDVDTGATKLTEMAEQMMLDAFEVAETGSVDIKVKCVLWNQGEAEDNDPTWADAYYRNLRNWIAYIRGVVGDPTLPIVVVTINENSSQFNQIVRDAQLRIGGRLYEWNGSAVVEIPHTGEDPFVWVYNQDGHPWTTIGDDLHMNAALNELVAADVFEIIKDL